MPMPEYEPMEIRLTERAEILADTLVAMIQALEGRKTRVNMPGGMSMANYARQALFRADMDGRL